MPLGRGRAQRHAGRVRRTRLVAALMAEPFSERPGVRRGSGTGAGRLRRPGDAGQHDPAHRRAPAHPTGLIPARAPDSPPFAWSDRTAAGTLAEGGAGCPCYSARWPPGTPGHCATARSMSRRPSGRPLSSPGSRPRRTARERGPLPSRRAARPAHRHAQPGALRRPAGRRSSDRRARDPDRSVLHRPGRVQGCQRQPRPPGRRPAADRRRRAAHPAGRGARSRGGPVRRRRVRAADRGHIRHRGCGQGGRHRDGAADRTVPCGRS